MTGLLNPGAVHPRKSNKKSGYITSFGCRGGKHSCENNKVGGGGGGQAPLHNLLENKEYRTTPHPPAFLFFWCGIFAFWSQRQVPMCTKTQTSALFVYPVDACIRNHALFAAPFRFWGGGGKQQQHTHTHTQSTALHRRHQRGPW